MARDLESHDVWLLMSGGEIYPFSATGFDVAQGPLGTVIERSADSLFLNADGEVFAIAGITARDTGIGARIARLLGGGYGIRVELRPRQIDLPTLKSKIVGGLERYHATADADESWPLATAPLPESRRAIMEAGDAQALYAALSLPPSMDCLDVL